MDLDPELDLDAEFGAALYAIDAAAARRVHEGGCPRCGGALDRADFPRKPRGDVAAMGPHATVRFSFCCRRDSCRKRATPPSLRFLGRKIYLAATVVIASAVGQTMRLVGRDRARQVRDVPVRTVRRWLAWWQIVFALGGFWAEAKGAFATLVAEAELPASLFARFGAASVDALTKMLAFLAPVTTASASRGR